MAEAEEALATNKLCSTQQLDWLQVLAEERHRLEQEQERQRGQDSKAATAGASQV